MPSFAIDHGDVTISSGSFRNGDGSTGVAADDTVGNAVVTGGNFYNGLSGGKGTVATAVLDGGSFYNGWDEGTGIVGSVTVNVGVFYSGSYGGQGTVTTAVHNGGTFYNGWGTGSTGTIESVTVGGGVFYNGYGGTGTIGSVTVDGGTFYNGYYAGSTGTIENLTFNGGKYNPYDVSVGTGTIDALTLGTKVDAAQGAEFSKSDVQTLSFGENYGLLTITAEADETYSNTINVSAAAIDLTGVDLMLNVQGIYGSAADIVSGAEFSLQELFAGYGSVIGGDLLGTFGLSFGAETLDVLTASGWTTGWSYANGVIAYEIGDDGNGGNSTPEPATLLVFGAGLAGLAVSRLRRRK